MPIEVQHNGVTCRFTDEHLDRNRPGRIRKALLKGRFYEQNFLEYIASLGIRGRYVDVGANIGTHTVFFAVYCAAEQVYAFEPHPDAYRELVRNVALNAIGDRVRTVNIALADTPGRVEINGRQGPRSVPAGRLDDVAVSPVAVIKIDVEGMEPAVLAGAGRVLTEDRPVVFAEAATDHERAAVSSTLAAHGYEPTGRVFNATPTYEFRAS